MSISPTSKPSYLSHVTRPQGVVKLVTAATIDHIDRPIEAVDSVRSGSDQEGIYAFFRKYQRMMRGGTPQNRIVSQPKYYSSSNRPENPVGNSQAAIQFSVSPRLIENFGEKFGALLGGLIEQRQQAGTASERSRSQASEQRFYAPILMA